ncbi:MAG: hypothetical protein ABSF64_26915 [Bryobacteraceae bacterium]
MARKLPAAMRTEEEKEQLDERHDELPPEEREHSEPLTVPIEALEDANYAFEGSTSDRRLRSLMEGHLRQRLARRLWLSRNSRRGERKGDITVLLNGKAAANVMRDVKKG